MITIHTFESQTAPDRERWLACFYTGVNRLPVVISGSTEEEARTRADDFLAAEKAKDEARIAANEKRAAARSINK